jgi:hypothetical protein
VWKGLTALAILFLAAHLPSLPPSLEDIDSVNFALGVRHFDVAPHQPHPPGYPVYIALSKLSTAALRAAGVPAAEARGLALWGAVAGASMILLAAAFFRALGGDGGHAALSAVLLACAPLFWFTALRPLSDMVGLAAAFAALAPIATAIAAGDRDRPSGALLTLGAFLAGVAVGVRSQTFVLTFPLLGFALLRPRRGIRGATRLHAAAAFGAGVLLWAIPLVVVSGGPGAYLHAVRSQGVEDFSGVVMLWTHPTIRVAAYALLYTLVLPWRSPVLAAVVLVLAAFGSLLLLRRSPRMLLMLAIVFGPYAVFHLLFQETVTLRYSLPLLAPVVYLAVMTLSRLHRAAAVAGVAGLAAAGLTLSVPAGIAYGLEPAPVFRMLTDMRHIESAPVAIGMHRPVFTETRRIRLWAGPMHGELLPVPRDYEWLELTRTLRETPERPAWFVVDPRRTDLALIDPQGRSSRAYRWPFDAAVFVGGARPSDMDWHIYSRPGWFLEQGWALTPEIAGVTDRDGWGPHRRPSVGWVRRRAEEAHVIFGGRHLGAPTDPPAVVTALIDGRQILRLSVTPGFFLHTGVIPAGTLQGEGGYARLTVTAAAAKTSAVVPPVAIEQFNLQPPDTVMIGFAQGWHEPEYNPDTRQSWRWLSNRSSLWLQTGGNDVSLCLEGESPRKYYDSAPTIRVSAGDWELGRFSPEDDFEECVSVPPAALKASNGRVTIESSLTHVPAERDGVADRRRLGLRIYSARLAHPQRPVRR